jgi:FeS assembly SUF system protein
MNNPAAHPEGAAKLVDPDKVKPVVDESLASRGAPGQAYGPVSLPKDDGTPDRAKLPSDAEGNPRNLSLDEARKLKDSVIATLKTIFDPEIPVNVYELGLVYNVSVGLDGAVEIRMTLTSPACPVAGTLPGDVERKLRTLDWATQAKVQLVWDPPWNKSMMSDAAKLELNVA